MDQNTEKKSPMELINEVPPIKVDARVVACEGGMCTATIALLVGALETKFGSRVLLCNASCEHCGCDHG